MRTSNFLGDGRLRLVTSVASRTDLRRPRDGRPRFDRAILPGGYQRFTVDATSPDGSLSLVVSALIGNPFSPAYARARARGDRRPLSFCALGVALHGPSSSLRSMRERSIQASARSADGLEIGASSMRRIGDDLVIDIDERTTPFGGGVTSLLGRELRGRVVVRAEGAPAGSFFLDRAGEHTWWPVMPSARVEVDLVEPGVRFLGQGHHGVSAGDVPLEESFTGWSWSWGSAGRGRTFLMYEGSERGGGGRSHPLSVDEAGCVRRLTGLFANDLPLTGWRLPRSAPGDRPVDGTVLRELEDTPFHARSLVRTRLGGQPVTMMHEALSIDRLRSSWVQLLLGLRMGRG